MAKEIIYTINDDNVEAEVIGMTGIGCIPALRSNLRNGGVEPDEASYEEKPEIAQVTEVATDKAIS